MYDIIKINKMIEDLNRFFKELKDADLSSKNINETIRLNAAAMSIFSIINRSIDLAQEIIIIKELGMPNSYSESFEPLVKEGIINKDLAKKMQKLIEKRGLFAHHYFSANPREVLKLNSEIYIVKEFVDKVKKEVSKEAKR